MRGIPNLADRPAIMCRGHADGADLTIGRQCGTHGTRRTGGWRGGAGRGNGGAFTMVHARAEQTKECSAQCDEQSSSKQRERRTVAEWAFGWGTTDGARTANRILGILRIRLVVVHETLLSCLSWHHQGALG